MVEEEEKDKNKKKTRKHKPKKEKKATEKIQEEEEKKEKELEIIEAEKAYIPSQKSALPAALKNMLKIRSQINRRRPLFRRQEGFRYKRLETSWRKPRGIQSKMRRHFGYRPNVVSIGYRSPKIVRGLHPSGFKEISVYNVKELEALNPKLEAARIAGCVGTKKRMEIQKKAEELGIRVLNKVA